LAGYSNILSKMIGSNNKLNNALATILALASYKHADYFSSLRVVKAIEGKDEAEVEEKPAKKAAPKAEKAEKSEEKKVAKKAPAKKAEKEEAEEKPANKAPAKKATKKEEK
jgi:hypothetical protein